ncbi:MAG: DUF1223 domain-containing protein [Pseudomonadota bacterium]
MRTMRYGLGLMLLAASLVGAEPLRLESGTARVHLLELYTSEGCSSCPPADRWLSTLKDDPRLWREVVPVALHVDYWDYLGWEDRFATAENSLRQRDLARAGRFQVYTPGFVLGGREWRRGFLRRTLELPPAVDVGRLSVELDGELASVAFEPVIDVPGTLEAHVVQLAFDQQTRVGAGENRRRTLVHDFVVLSRTSVPLEVDAGGRHAGGVRLPYAGEAEAVAAWVSVKGEPQPLQATGGPLGSRSFGTRSRSSPSD